MLLLASTADQLRLVTTAGLPTDVHTSWVDLNTSAIVTPGRTNSVVTMATATTIVGSPAAGGFRTVKTLHVRNKSLTTTQTVAVVHYDGANSIELIRVELPAGFVLHYDEGAGFNIFDAFGRRMTNMTANSQPPAVNALNMVVLATDVTSAAAANTLSDVTGLSFPVTAGHTYRFAFNIHYTAAATATGSRWTINGPGSPTMLRYNSDYYLSATARTQNNGLNAYDMPAASNATSSTTSNIATIDGFITPSTDGIVVARFAAEIANSAVIARAGSLLQWVRVL